MKKSTKKIRISHWAKLHGKTRQAAFDYQKKGRITVEKDEFGQVWILEGTPWPCKK